jgi:hypothetical protein
MTAQRTVWKFKGAVSDAFTVPMPVGAKVVHVEAAPGYRILLWAEVDPTAPVEARSFHVHVRGTGNEITADVGAYLATIAHGPLVWHLFERVTLEEDL